MPTLRDMTTGLPDDELSHTAAKRDGELWPATDATEKRRRGCRSSRHGAVVAGAFGSWDRRATGAQSHQSGSFRACRTRLRAVQEEPRGVPSRPFAAGDVVLFL